MEQGKKSYVLSRIMLSLEGQLSALRSKITRLEDGDLYMTEILEAASEHLNCKLFGAPRVFFADICVF
jgi:hypothetical protein